MSDEFTKQYAIRLPNGKLHAHRPHGFRVVEGVIVYTQDDEAEPDVVVYDTLEEAEDGIRRFQAQAAHMGITEWLGHIESRVCSPFTDSSSEAGKDMIEGLTKFLEDK